MKKRRWAWIVVLAILMLAATALAVIPEYMFSVGVDGDSFVAKSKELNMTFRAATPEEAYDLAVVAIKAHKDKYSTISEQVATLTEQISALEKQMAELAAQKEKLEVQDGKSLDAYYLIDPQYMEKYKARLGILTTKTPIEEKLGVDTNCVLYRLAPGNIYGTPLIHGWGFHKWEE